MVGNAVVDNEYYNWLVDQIAYDVYVEYEDVQKLEILSEIPFTWSVANDDNRAKDGLQLRSIFMDEQNWSTVPFYGKECTMLEMMVALAMRIENDIMYDPDISDRTSLWFWTMYDNLGLRNAPICATFDICATFCARNFDKSGTGGMFPLRQNHGKNQQKVEIWGQMQAYLMENYDF